MADTDEMTTEHCWSSEIEVYDGHTDSALCLRDVSGSTYRIGTLPLPEGAYMFTVWVKPMGDMSLHVNMLGLDQYYDLSGGEWTKLQIYNEDPEKDSEGNIIRYIDIIPVYRNTGSDINNDLYLYKAMLELGNRASDWTPAPEEVDDSIDQVYKEIEITKSSLIKTMDDSITASVTKVTTEYENKIQVAQETLSGEINTMDSKIEQAVTRVNDVNGYITEQKTWQRFDENGITLGKVENNVESPFTMTLTNTELSFNENQVPVSYINNKKMYITDAQINHMLQFGNFAFMPTSTGMAIVYVEGE
jgi:hypothetical protein